MEKEPHGKLSLSHGSIPGRAWNRIDDVKVLSLTQGLGLPYIYAYSLLSGSWKVTDILHTEGHSSNLTPYTILELSWGTDCM